MVKLTSKYTISEKTHEVYSKKSNICESLFSGTFEECCDYVSNLDESIANVSYIRKLSSLNTVTEDLDDEISEIEQEFTSQNTSINSTKLPAIFKLVKFEPNTINLDYGGGKFDNAAEYLKEFDVTNLVYDPYNRTGAHNSEVIKTIKQNGGADSATCSNVLNVVKEENVRINILNNIKKLVKPNGKIYITVYEGSGSGDGAPTKAGYQMNRKTDDYLEEIKSVFPDATRRGKLITATNSNSSKLVDESISGSELHKAPLGTKLIDANGRIYVKGKHYETPWKSGDDRYSSWYLANASKLNVRYLEDNLDGSLTEDDTSNNDDYDRIDRNGSDEEQLLAAIAYQYGVSIDKAREYEKELTDKEKAKAIKWYNLRALPSKIRLKKMDESLNDPDEVLNFKRDIELADSLDDIQDLIYSLSDGVAEDNCQTAFYENEDKDLQILKDAVISALDVYLEDNEWLGESKSITKDISDIEKVVSKYDDAFYNKDEKLIDCGSEKTCRAIAKELNIGPQNTSNSPVAHLIYLDNEESLTEDSDQLDIKFADDEPEKYIKLDLMEPDDNYSHTIGGKEVPYKSHDEAKRHLKDFKFSDYEKELYEFLRSKDMYNEMYVEPDNTLCIRVENGDWKHEHLYLDNLIHKFFFDKGLIIDSQKEVTSSNNSDCFSAIHYYRIIDVVFVSTLKPTNEAIDGWDDRTGIIKRIDKYLCQNSDVKPPKGYVSRRSRNYEVLANTYGDYVTTPFSNISTDDLMLFAKEHNLINEHINKTFTEDVNKYFALMSFESGSEGPESDSFDMLAVTKASNKEEAQKYFDNQKLYGDYVTEIPETAFNEFNTELIEEDRLEDINFVMSNYVSMIFDKVEGKDTDWTISYHNETVNLKFDPSYGEYVYTLDGEGPYSHSSYEFISRDIMDYIDTHKIKSEDTQVKENTNQQLNNIKDSYLRDAWTFEPYVGSDKDNMFQTKVHRNGLGTFSVYVKGFNYNNLEELQELSEVKIQVTAIKPYDDAEYHWAKYENNVTKIIKNGKVVKKIPTDLSSMNPDSQKDAIDFVICDICNTLADLNVDIEPKMVHN